VGNVGRIFQNDYCIYAVSFDGFDGTGRTTYTTAQEQARKLETFLCETCGGALDILFAESLGCGPAIFLNASPQIRIRRMILSGPEYLDFGPLNPLILKTMPQKQYRTAHEKTMPAWALRFMGQTEQGMNTMLRRIPDNISLESVRATWEVGLYLSSAPAAGRRRCLLVRRKRRPHEKGHPETAGNVSQTDRPLLCRVRARGHPQPSGIACGRTETL